MLPTILQSETSPLSKDPHSAITRTHKTDVDILSGHAIYSKLMQNHQIVITQGVRASKGHKTHPNPPSSVEYFPTIPYNILSHPKFAKSTKSPSQAEIKHKGSPLEKKRLKGVPDRTREVPKPLLKMMEVQANDFESSNGRKSLPHNSIPSNRHTPQSGVRDILKAKYKARETQANGYNSVSIHEKVNRDSKEGVVNKSSYESIPVKHVATQGKRNNNERVINKFSYENITNTPNTQISANYQQFLSSENIKTQDYKPNSCVAREKNLLHSKEPQKTINLTSFVSMHSEGAEEDGDNKDIYLKEMLHDVLKKTSSVPSSQKKDDMHYPIVKLLVQTTEKKDHNRSPSLNSRPKKNIREATSVSPSKKKRSYVSEKVIKEMKPEKSVVATKKRASIAVYLSEEEKAQYGDRKLADYEKLELLGKGGFALVWLGICKSTGIKVAMKQMAKNSGGESKKNDLYYGQFFFNEGEPRDKFKKYPGIAHIARFIDYKTTKHDDWHISELCGKALSSLLFDMKGEFCNSERVYGVKHLELHHQFRCDGHSLRTFIKNMAEAFHLFSDCHIVHSDIKPENILLSMDSSGKGFSLKIIDFGSAYNWRDSGNIKMATPEYMPPEFLNILAGKSATENSIEQLAEMSNPWSVDVWSLGAILLEIITGIPLWIPLKCKLENKKSLRYGLFAAKGRDYDKIYLKQKALVENLEENLGEYLRNWPDAETLFDLLGNMLMWDPKERISPADILKHPFLQAA